MTKEEIIEAVENVESIDGRKIGDRNYDLYNVEIDGIEVSVIDSYEYGKERITLTPKDGTMILKSLDGAEDSSAELREVAEVY